MSNQLAPWDYFPEPGLRVKIVLQSSDGVEVGKPTVVLPPLIEPIIGLVSNIRLLKGLVSGAQFVSSDDDPFFSIEKWYPAERILVAKLK
jgi:hypothetical protein